VGSRSTGTRNSNDLPQKCRHGRPEGMRVNEEIRPLSANRNTLKAMEQRGLISPGKGRDPLTIVWRLKKK
jgi:hypothetical protein